MMNLRLLTMMITIMMTMMIDKDDGDDYDDCVCDGDHDGGDGHDGYDDDDDDDDDADGADECHHDADGDDVMLVAQVLILLSTRRRPTSCQSVSATTVAPVGGRVTLRFCCFE